ncbi:hypothetical protein FT663_03340 [Candidozyma haemuli var. vulneris]|uniref:DUF202 domain-containing protein n=1 Tax=Candidozyma haemuli TaxID=45357 RepID=A0A2V1AUL3_9ASCO|nr:hypothetical protein CXQ85_000480 [[Candida] haemuloni]KAF3989449.1 hypothetical protein FT662_02815 [[Candida] haemuloni var. vulneris]KAF3990095.1 hypothetical protein FT663_03340 [[Candida] haemuloni var. vulneris]PVH21499.1 hypothetical protein CXQ85_000480 [[Candida] haemuloni]
MTARESRSPSRARNSTFSAYTSRQNSPFRTGSIASESDNDVALFHPDQPVAPQASQTSRASQPATVQEPESKRRTWFGLPKVLDVTSSEPRDVLQSERTLLAFVRFSTSLYFAATGMIMGFHLRTSGKEHKHLPNFNNNLFNKITAAILIVLAFSTLIISGINYFRTVRRYSQHRIHTYGFNNITMILCVTAVVVTLIGINIALIIERFIDHR